MSRSRILKEDEQLEALRETELKLKRMAKEAAEIPKRLEREARERECTMPPLGDIEERRLRRAHEEIVSRGEIANIQRVQTKSLTLLFLLLSATASLVWWGLKLMQG